MKGAPNQYTYGFSAHASDMAVRKFSSHDDFVIFGKFGIKWCSKMQKEHI